MAKRGRDIVQDEAGDLERSRLDRWLWVARFFKTRALAAEAINGGKVLVNGERPKRAKPIQVGDQVRIRLGPYEHHVAVVAIAARRGPATEASLLYQETPESQARRNETAARLKAEAAAFPTQDGRPTKRDRREIAKLRGRG
jgi:ribosome-associated heat shock protein Hsp15